MKALITGGAGFIGSHLAERLSNRGDQVTVVDDLSTGTLENLHLLRSRDTFTFVRDSVRNTAIIQPLIEQCDMVFHLAAAVGVQLIADKPVHTIETNIHGTEVILDAACKFHKKVLLASSSEVYGKSEAVPFREDDDMVMGSTRFPRWAYACSKAVDEFLGLAYHQESHLEVVIARFFNTIGPRQTGAYGMVVPRFVGWALKGEPILIYGTGRQQRSFCYVRDVVDAVVDLMDSNNTAGQVYNIGSNCEISIEALADKIIQMTESSSTKKFVPYHKAYGRAMDDMMRRVPSLERINSAIGWESKTSLTDTLEIIINHFKKACV